MSERAGEVNAYVCQTCGWRAITINRDDGTTPFQIGCEACKRGGAYSMFYRVDQAIKPTHEWYRPDAAEAKRLGKLWRDHLAGGGMKLRRIESGVRDDR